MKTWNSPCGELTLGCFPYDGADPSHQAWNAADQLLARWFLEGIEEKNAFTQAEPGKNNFLVMNDRYGALRTFFSVLGTRVEGPEDSFCAQKAARENLIQQGFQPQNSDFQSFSDFFQNGPARQIDLACLQIPENLVLFRAQLIMLSQKLPPKTPLVFSALSKYLHKKHLEIIQELVDSVCISRAYGKARLIFGEIRTPVETQDFPFMPVYQKLEQYIPEGFKADFASFFDSPIFLAQVAGLFSARKADAASLLLLKTFFEKTAFQTADFQKPLLDLGCGNGLLSLLLATRFPNSSYILSDDSLLALDSAAAGFQKSALPNSVCCNWNDCAQDLPDESVSQILCNPPFHNGRGQTLALARRMFEQSARLLEPGGRLWLVANRHLGYHVYLKSLFRKVKLQRDEAGFVVLEAQK